MVVAILTRKSRGLRTLSDLRVSLTMVFDAMTFATSALLIWGIIDPLVLAALGDTRLFLIVAGILGMVYSMNALVRPS